MARGLETKDATRKPRCHPVCGRVASAPFPRGPICAPCLPLGISFWAGPADSACATALCPPLRVLCPSQSPVPTPPPAWLYSLPSYPRGPRRCRRLESAGPGCGLRLCLSRQWLLGTWLHACDLTLLICKYGIKSPAHEMGSAQCWAQSKRSDWVFLC